MSKEALKLALEALELNNNEWKSLADSGDSGYWKAEDQDHYKQTNQAINALREALAEQPAQQEPVAWRYLTKYKDQSVWTYCAFEPTSRETWEALYTSPPAQRIWVGLTDEEFQWIYDHGRTPAGMMELVEAKLKEKNT